MTAALLKELNKIDVDENINQVFPASTVSTQLLLTNTLLALPDLCGEVGGTALATTLFGLTLLVGWYLRGGVLRRVLSKAGHADNDLQVLNRPTSCLGRMIWFVTLIFRWCCSFMQSFQLQSSKVSNFYKQKITVYHNSEITSKLLNLFHKCPS